MSARERKQADRRGARVGSVVVGYLGASWLILQVVATVRDLLPLPTWIAPGTLILLGVGLVFVVATAWIQADPDTTRREEAGELPGDWQVAPKEAFAALLRGRLPHLTWARTLVAGVVALSLLFGAAGVYVLVTERSKAAVAVDASGTIRVAAMPFTTTGADLGVYREGMVELLATNLDGLGDIRAIAGRTVLARWDDVAGENDHPDLDTVLETARMTGATHALVGSIIAAGANVRLSAQLFDLVSGAELSVPRVEGPAADILALVDNLSVSVARALLGSEHEVETTGSRLASLTTASVPALRLYLQAEALYRRAEFADALPLLDQAIAADPRFGLAVMRRAQAMGWIPGAIPEDTLEAARLAIAPLLGGMSQRDATLAEAGIIAFAERNPEGPRRLREFVTRYPEDAEGWYQLSDFLYHLNDIRGGMRDEVLGGFDHAVEFSPRFAPYYIHALEGALLKGDTVRTRQLLRAYRELGADASQQTLALLLLSHPDSVLPADVASRVPDLFTTGMGRLTYMSDLPQTAADLTGRYLEPGDIRRVQSWLRAGRWAAIRTEAPAFPARVRNSIRTRALRWAGAFGLERSEAARIIEGTDTITDPGFWLADPEETLERLLAARDDGTGADPVLLAHVAERAGETERAGTFFEEESWREFGPAMVFRLAKLYEATGRSDEALETYRRFLSLWSGADPDLPPVLEAKDAVRRLSGMAAAAQGASAHDVNTKGGG